MEITAGKYRHYKGGEYEVFFVARHSETEEEVVVYRTLYGDFSYYRRRCTPFLDGSINPRPVPDLVRVASNLAI